MTDLVQRERARVPVERFETLCRQFCAAAAGAARTVAATLAAQFPGAAYLVVERNHDVDEAPRPHSVLGPEGRVLHRFDESRLPTVPADLAALWAPADPVQEEVLTDLLVLLASFGFDFDDLPEDLPELADEDFPLRVECLLLSEKGRPLREEPWPRTLRPAHPVAAVEGAGAS
ncbi:hypothetical protein ABT095_14985 [Kitasatospora sp. NPDC002227]|uniref:hypothetical protein n=1 Tax=Kitasatospora sp. NPDC002227 TaxID=3154773 RepID=UPI003327185A